VVVCGVLACTEPTYLMMGKVRNAKLASADLRGADLSKASLTRTKFYNTVMPDGEVTCPDTASITNVE